jgi:hypothetical protein
MGVGVVLVVVCIGVAVFAVRGVLTSEAEELNSQRMFIDASTGKPYKFELKLGQTFPAKAPSGGNTGYPAEACYWNKDGSAKKEPTYVLLNLYKGSNEPTFCPDCGRLVVGHNPAPGPDVRPPPTKEEYKTRRGNTPSR